MRTWLSTLPDEETNVHAWVHLGAGRWLALTVWGPTVFDHGPSFDVVLSAESGWEEL